MNQITIAPGDPRSGFGGIVEANHLDDFAKEKRIGWIAITLFFGVFLGWASFVRLDAAAYASGVIAVAGNRQVVQHRDGGRVSAINVREGQRVKAGQVLIRLGSAEVIANERSLSSQLISLKAQRARLLAEQIGTPFAAPAEFSAMTGADRADADQAVRIQISELGSRRRALIDQKAVFQQQAAQLSEQVRGIGGQLAANSRQDELFGDELAGMQRLAERGYASMNRVRALQRAEAELANQTAGLTASAASARKQIGETRLQGLSLDSQRGQQVAEDLRAVESQINDVDARYRAAKELLENTQIRATASGQVVGLDVFTVGGVVAPGQKLMEIVPDAAPLVIQIKVQPNDGDDVHIGQSAEIQIPALHDRSLPVLSGTVSRMSADSFHDEATGQSYFTAQVTVPVAEVKMIRRARGEVGAIRPGLPVEVLIPLRKRTLLQYLLEPLHQALWRSFREH